MWGVKVNSKFKNSSGYLKDLDRLNFPDRLMMTWWHCKKCHGNPAINYSDILLKANDVARRSRIHPHGTMHIITTV